MLIIFTPGLKRKQNKVGRLLLCLIKRDVMHTVLSAIASEGGYEGKR